MISFIRDFLDIVQPTTTAGPSYKFTTNRKARNTSLRQTECVTELTTGKQSSVAHEGDQ